MRPGPAALSAGLAAVLLLALASAAPPARPPAKVAVNAAGSPAAGGSARVHRAARGAVKGAPSLAGATKMAAARMKQMQKTPSPGTTMARGSTRAHSEAKGLRAAVGRHLKRSDFKAQMRKTIERSGVVETAQALRRNGVTMTQALTDIFIAYDTDARRAQLQLGPLQGSTEQKFQVQGPRLGAGVGVL